MKINYQTFKWSVRVLIMMYVGIGLFSCNTPEKKNKGNEKAQQNVVDVFAAAYFGDTKAMQYHIEQGADLNAKDQYGSTPLIIAATFNREEVARQLIDAGVDLNLKNGSGSTALHTAVFLCRVEIAKSLLEAGADKSLTDNFGSTALQAVSAPFESVKGIYVQLNKDLGPMGFKVDARYLMETRPVVAEMLK